jgi:glucose/arabinose dehydrogenase
MNFAWFHACVKILFTSLLLLLLSACSGIGGGASTSTPPIAPTRAATSPALASPTVANTLPATAASSATPAGTETVSQPAATQSAPPDTATNAPAAGTASVTSLPDPSGYSWQVVVSGLQRPLDLQSPRDGSGRLFVVEQPGLIRVLQDNQLLPEPFLDIRDRVGSGGSEQGLLGLAFHPQVAQNGFFFLNYTDRSGDTVIARYSISPGNPNQADPGSERILLQVDQPYANHNGGQVAFGPDGYLYIALGDGGSGGDPQGNGQSTNTLLGKLLRIDVDNGERYAIPADNPFVTQGGLPEIWAYGLRNPWRFSFDRATGDVYIADVGQNAWEEINFWPAGAAAGANFGWDIREGAHPFEGNAPAGVELVDPVAEYPHPTGCSVTGGYVYRGQALPDMQGVYLYSDFCSGKVWGLLRLPDGSWQNSVLFETGLRVSSFGLDEAGEIYLVDQSNGSVSLLSR